MENDTGVNNISVKVSWGGSEEDLSMHWRIRTDNVENLLERESVLLILEEIVQLFHQMIHPNHPPKNRYSK